MAQWLLQGDPTKYRMLAAAVDFSETTWAARQSAGDIKVGDKVVFWMSGDNAGAYALGAVSATATTCNEDPRFVAYWSDPTEAGKAELRIRATQDRLLVASPVLRQTALNDDILKAMLIIKRPAGTVFPLTDEQYARLTSLAQRTNAWTRPETTLVAACYVRTRTEETKARGAEVTRLARLLDRSESTVAMALSNFRFLDTGVGLEKSSALARDVWQEHAHAPDTLLAVAKEIEDCLLAGGGLALLTNELRLSRSIGEIRLSVARFNREAKTSKGRAVTLARQTTYWVYDAVASTFGPAKFVAFANLGIERYDQVVELVVDQEDPVITEDESASATWVDLPADQSRQKTPKKKPDGTHTTITLALEMTGAPGGATLEEIDERLSSLPLKEGHNARTLLRWMSRERGWGFQMEPATKKITLRTAKSSVSRIDGNQARRQVAKVVGTPFEADGVLAEKMKTWAAALFGENVFQEGLVAPDKWKFVTLPAVVAKGPRRYWKVAPGEQARLWSLMLQEGISAIGWNSIPLGKLQQATETDFKAKVRSIKSDASTSMVSQLWDFAQIKPGDIIVANKGQSAIVGRGEVVGTYQLRPEGEEYRHALPVRWFDTHRRDIPDQGSRWRPTVVELTEDEYRTITGEKPVAKPNVGPGIYDYLKQRGLRFPTELVTTYLLSLKTKPFVILSGISGTGKTKLAQAVAEWAGVEERTTEQEEPATSPTGSSFTWTYKLQPYNFDHRKIVLARGAENLFDLHEVGSKKLALHFEGEDFEGSLGAIRPKGRLIYELRLGRLAAKLQASMAAGDYVTISVQHDTDDETFQRVIFERVAKKVRTRTEKIQRYDFVSVRPDWLDGKEVLGFYNVLTEEYVPRPFLKLLLQAHRDGEKPYFAILDEMNLARVEHYFADLLSATESRKPNADGDGVEQEPVHLHDAIECLPLSEPDGWERPSQCKSCRGTDAEIAACPLWFDGVQLVPPRLRIPRNVHVTGTVNIDETTHQFSPKVLDRSNVIEFNHVDLSSTGTDDDDGFALADGLIDLGNADVATLQHLHASNSQVQTFLVDLNGILEPFNLHFGYRVANEIALYAANAEKYVGADSTGTALDLQMLQKVLPKLHGSKQRLLVPLWRLLLFSVNGELAPRDYRDEDLHGIEVALAGGSLVPVPGPEKKSVKPWMPRSARKLARMLRTLKEQGFVSFIE